MELYNVFLNSSQPQILPLPIQFLIILNGKDKINYLLIGFSHPLRNLFLLKLLAAQLHILFGLPLERFFANQFKNRLMQLKLELQTINS